MAGFAAASVLAFDDDDVTADIQEALHTPLFRIYRNTDVVGCELCGVLKNDHRDCNRHERWFGRW